MPSPFPGMDPYIERPVIWPDFHDSLIAVIRAVLQPLLRPRYVALMQGRLFVVESDRTRREEMREPLIHILEPAAGNRIVTAIEVLSPDNKEKGAGRTNCLRKREELWENGANLVEIDLLRHGQHTIRVADDHLESLRPFNYVVAVTRCWPCRHEVYPIPLARRLPRFSIPLQEGDKDVVLDLQVAFSRCWEEGPYPELLEYAGPPPGTLTTEQGSWCEGILAAAGYRTKPGNGQKSE